MRANQWKLVHGTQTGGTVTVSEYQFQYIKLRVLTRMAFGTSWHGTGTPPLPLVLQAARLRWHPLDSIRIQAYVIVHIPMIWPMTKLFTVIASLHADSTMTENRFSVLDRIHANSVLSTQISWCVFLSLSIPTHSVYASSTYSILCGNIEVL